MFREFVRLYHEFDLYGRELVAVVAGDVDGVDEKSLGTFIHGFASTFVITILGSLSESRWNVKLL